MTLLLEDHLAGFVVAAVLPEGPPRTLKQCESYCISTVPYLPKAACSENRIPQLSMRHNQRC